MSNSVVSLIFFQFLNQIQTNVNYQVRKKAVHWYQQITSLTAKTWLE